jgi:pyridoxamine 5'-phosphate oxidase
MSIADIRREYSLTGLRRADLDPDPMVQFKKWFDQETGKRKSGRVRKFFIRIYKSLLMISGAESLDLNAMTLATVDTEGRPSARIVLLKGIDERGFVFYTNYESRKGRELSGNPNASLVFYWPEQERQVCVAGRAEKLAAAESETYFHSRPRGSQIGAWASHQSAVVRDRVEMEKRWAEHEEKFTGKEVPLPPFWGGYVLRPDRIEFWQGRPNRMHDRFRYTRSSSSQWVIERLSP